MGIIEDLQWRDLIHLMTNEEELRKTLENEKITLYAGFDPTADSLHIGNLLPLLTLKRFQMAGHRPIALVGSATGMIGDPSGKQQERTLNEKYTVLNWSFRIGDQIDRITGIEIIGNNKWIESLSTIDFLRNVGKYFSVNTMLAKESVSSRLESGISFTEFSYLILQSFDFLNLFEKEKCILQIGGSDQWGNMVSGIELIRKKMGEQTFGLTIPLITKADGSKFGKTENGTVWLDKKKTSVYEFYQFWINTTDEDVIRFLKYFTFLDKEKIEWLEKDRNEYPERRLAQKKLAEEVTSLVHGEKAFQNVKKISEALFTGEVQDLEIEQFELLCKQIPTVQLVSFAEKNIIELLVDAGFIFSKRQAREDITNGAIAVNGKKIKDVNYQVTKQDWMKNHYLIIRKGKKKYFMIKIL